MALKPLQDAFRIEAVSVVTLQALSGAGYPGPSAGDMLGNVIPHIDGEEEKLAIEPGKILGRWTPHGIDPAPFVVSAHCNRVPVLDGHLLCVSARLESQASEADVTRVLGDFLTPEMVRGLPSCPERAIMVMHETDRPQPRRDRGVGGGMTVSIGRVRRCETHDVKFIVLVHNTIRGAAGGALLCAELLAQENRLSRRACDPASQASPVSWNTP